MPTVRAAWSSASASKPEAKDPAGIVLPGNITSEKENHMVRGYKGFNADMTCQGFQYEPGKAYEMDSRIEPCERGFHFCRNMADVFDYYGKNGCRYAEVEAFGKVIDSDDKSVTDRIRIVRELTRAEVLEIMYTREGLDFKDSPFPTDKIIRARENGTLGEMLPSGAEVPVQFSNGEKNILVVGRDKDHTYLITKYLMAEKFAMNDKWTDKGGWPACEMREHMREIYNMFPEDIRKTIIPMHIRQTAQDKVAECDNQAFLLSAVNVFGNDPWDPEADCDDSQIDIFKDHAIRIKKRPGASSASWWWLRSATSDYSFYSVYADGSIGNCNAFSEGGVVVGFCIETRPCSSGRLCPAGKSVKSQKRMPGILSWIKEKIWYAATKASMPT